MRMRWLIVVALGLVAGCGSLLGLEDDPPAPPAPGVDAAVEAGPNRDGQTEGGDAGQDLDAASDACASANTASDPSNCGACGRKCNLDGGCESGTCERLVAFVTSNTHSATFGGTAADKRCTDLAHDAGLGGDFRVWMGGPGTTNRFAPVAAPYHRTTGERISPKWPPGPDVLEEAIDRDERGVERANAAVWSDLANDGTVEPTGTVNNCQGWGTQAANQQGGYGRSSSKDGEWTRATTPPDMACSNQLRLYCIEKP